MLGSLAVVALLCGGLATIGALSNRQSLNHIDVQVTSCESTGSVAKVGFTVRNSGKQARRVTLDIEYRDAAGARLDTDTAYVGNVPAGDTVRGEESTILNAESTSLTCKVVKVS
ncbi:FxLYD domain-containing protein [Micromonospora chersina]|uniref:FxLYD domain-containing protein n=1 Tax=Micromonospora chersina TaxID=47854 RepID=UPI0037989A38